MKKVVEQDLPLDDLNIIWTMERFYNSDILFVGGFGRVAILFFDGRAFAVLGSVGNVPSEDPIVDMKLKDNRLYILSQPSRQLEKIIFTGYEEVRPEAYPKGKTPDSGKLLQVSDAFSRVRRETEQLPSSLR